MQNKRSMLLRPFSRLAKLIIADLVFAAAAVLGAEIHHDRLQPKLAQPSSSKTAAQHLKTLRVDRLTAAELQPLADNTVIEIGGFRTTALAIRRQIQEQTQQEMLKFRNFGPLSTPQPKHPAIFTRQKQQTLILESNAKVRTLVARVRKESVSATGAGTKNIETSKQMPGGTPMSGSLRDSPLLRPGPNTPGALSKSPSFTDKGPHYTNLDRPCAPLVAASSPPHISKVEGTFTPGGDILILGCNFGSPYDRGQIHLLGAFPGGYLNLRVMEWFDDHVTATIPAITGILDQTVKVQVVTKNQRYSTEKAVDFAATRSDPVVLPLTALQFQCGSAIQPGFNTCNGASSDNPQNLPLSLNGYQNCSGPSFCGSHDNFNTSYGGAGQDWFTATLKNGWVFENMYWTKQASHEAVISDPKGFTDGPPNFVKIVVDWSYAPRRYVMTCCPLTSLLYLAHVSYRGTFTIVGPMGVPYM